MSKLILLKDETQIRTKAGYRIIYKSQMFNDVAKQFLYFAQFGRHTPVSAQTLDSYKRGIKVLLKFFDRRKLTTIAKDDVFEIKKYFIDRNCSSGYIQLILSLLRNILRYAQNELNMDVLDPSLIKLPPKTRSKVEYLNDDEIGRVLSAIDTSTLSGYRFKAMVASMLESGLRISEALSMDRSSIDFRAQQAAIIGKGNKPGVVFFTDWSLNLLKTYLSLRTDSHPAMFVTHAPNQMPMRIDYDSVRKQFKDLANKLKMSKFRPHTLRRTFGTMISFRSGNIKDAQDLLRHSSLQYTQRYIGTDYARLQDVHKNTFRENMTLDLPVVRLKWCKDYDQCRGCGVREGEHAAKGYCRKCYMRLFRKKPKK